MAKQQSRSEQLRLTISTYRTGFYIAAAASLVAGLLILMFPATVEKFAMVLLAIYALVSGVIYLAMGFIAKDAPASSRTTRILAGVIFLLAGILAFSFMGAATAVLTNIVGIAVGVMWIAEGAMTIMMLRGKEASTGIIVYAVVAIAAGVLLLLTPVWGNAVLRWLLGFSLVGLGISQAIRAYTTSASLTVDMEEDDA